MRLSSVHSVVNIILICGVTGIIAVTSCSRSAGALSDRACEAPMASDGDLSVSCHSNLCVLCVTQDRDGGGVLKNRVAKCYTINRSECPRR